MQTYIFSGSKWPSLSNIFTETLVPFHFATWYDPWTKYQIQIISHTSVARKQSAQNHNMIFSFRYKWCITKNLHLDNKKALLNKAKRKKYSTENEATASTSTKNFVVFLQVKVKLDVKADLSMWADKIVICTFRREIKRTRIQQTKQLQELLKKKFCCLLFRFLKTTCCTK